MSQLSSVIAVELKKTDKVDFVKPITNYIKSSFSKEAADIHKPSIENLQNIRENIRLDVEKTEGARNKLFQYYCILGVLEKKVPIREDSVKLSFYWYDVLNKKRFSQYSLSYEKQNIIFNIAAMESNIGSLYDRVSEEGLKQASKFFQLSAGTFQYLKDQLQGEVVGPIDFSQNFLNICVHVMLGQAQECSYDIALKKKLSDDALCKLAAQIYIFYETVWPFLTSPDLKNAFISNNWLPIIQAKIGYYRAVASQHMAAIVFAKDEYGNNIGWLHRAWAHLNDPNILKIIKNIPAMRELYEMKKQQVGNLLRSAEYDNSKVYHEHVPSSSQLPSLGGKPLVKPFPFTPVVFDVDILKTLIPAEIKNSLSIYDEKKAQILRNNIDLIEDANNIAKSSLCSMNLPGSIQALENPSGIPDEIKHRIQTFKQEGGISRITELLITLNEMGEQSSVLLRSIDEILDKEEKDDDQIRSQLKEKWTRSPSHALTLNIRQEISKFKGNLEHARKSDNLVKTKYHDVEDMLRKLTTGDVAALIPKMDAIPDANDVIDELKFLMKDLDALIDARKILANNLRTMNAQDDISVRLLNSQDPIESIFADELNKYNPLTSSIQENLVQQETILNSIGNAHQKFVQRKSAASSSMARDVILTQIHLALSTVVELQDNISQGIQFYTNFQDILTTLKVKSEEFVADRNRNKQELLVKINQPQQSFVPQYQSPPQNSNSNNPPMYSNAPSYSAYPSVGNPPPAAYSQYQPPPPQFQPQYQPPPQQSQYQPQYQPPPQMQPNVQYVMVQGPNGQKQFFPMSSLPPRK